MTIGFSYSEIAIIVILFFMIAAVYSSVGFGGGSSYIAILALFSFPYLGIPQAALLCNIIVASGSVLFYIKNQTLRIKPAIPYVVTSVPMAFIGGRIQIEKELYLFLLSLVLIYAALKMLFFNRSSNNKKIAEKKDLKEPNFFAWIIGAAVGFLSGLIGIGGGIILAPMLHLEGRLKAKSIAAISAFFILVNSLSGLGGQLLKSGFSVEPAFMVFLAFAVFLGGRAGNIWSARKFSENSVSRITGVLVLFVAFRILYQIYFQH